MPLELVRQSITEVACDAVVNPTDPRYSGSGGVDALIHQAAGEELRAACEKLAPLSRGEVAVTPAFRMGCAYVIHTVGPVWRGGRHNEEALLRSCYRGALAAAVRLGARSVAFPLISSGTFGFPRRLVLHIATDEIFRFLMTETSEPQVLLCVPDPAVFSLQREKELRNFLETDRKRNVPPRRRLWNLPRYPEILQVPGPAETDEWQEWNEADEWNEGEIQYESEAELTDHTGRLPRFGSLPFEAVRSAAPAPSLSEWMRHQDDTFAVLLLKLIDRKGMDDVTCYKKANVHRNTFWKINNDASYKPSKPTVLAFAIALELTLPETEQLLKAAGFALSRSNPFDLIIEYYITNGQYDIHEINAALYRYDQPCLGC